jgi:hypothetical protein
MEPGLAGSEIYSSNAAPETCRRVEREPTIGLKIEASLRRSD